MRDIKLSVTVRGPMSEVYVIKMTTSNNKESSLLTSYSNNPSRWTHPWMLVVQQHHSSR